MRRTVYLFAALAACAPQSPPLLAPVPTLELSAPFDKTWNAVIDVFASQSFPIATIDKSSGLIVANSMSLRESDGMNWAKCAGIIFTTRFANRADFNVLVRPSAAGSTVRATARWTSVERNGSVDCPTTGVWERGFQLRLKQAIEGPP